MITKTRAFLDAEGNLVLRYLEETSASGAGFTAKQVAAGTGLDFQRTRQVLERLYVHKQVGRQGSLFGHVGTFWLPVKTAVRE